VGYAPDGADKVGSMRARVTELAGEMSRWRAPPGPIYEGRALSVPRNAFERRRSAKRQREVKSVISRTVEP
jgi:hypothetical protein